MSDQHVGVRRRPARLPVRRVVPLAAGLVMVAWLLALGEPSRDPMATPSATVVPTWIGPSTVDISGVLADGATYTPRLYLSPEVSVGEARAADGSVRVILARAPGTFTELRRRSALDRAQLIGFAVGGQDLVWMETDIRDGSPTTTLWRASLSGDGPPVQVTTNTGETSFYGLPTQVVVADGRVTWTALVAGQPVRTEVRSVALAGGRVDSRRLDGEFLLTTPPWATSLPGGPGSPVTLLNLDTLERVTFEAGPDEAAVCSPDWCRISVTAEAGLVGVDIMRPDGSQRRRIAGAEAAPTIREPLLMDRYVPLATNRADGVGLSLYDLTTGETQLIAPRAAEVGGRGSILWWSTGVGAELTWHALDLSRLP